MPDTTPPKPDIVTFLAETLTRLFSPITATFVGMSIIYSKYVTLPGRSGIPWLICTGSLFFVIIGSLVLFKKYKLISNWDITDRRQRPRFLAIVAVCTFLILVTTYTLGYSEAIPILLSLVLSMMAAIFITFFWKISFHTYAVTMCTIFVVATYQFLPLLVLMTIPVITGWTRVTLKKHTIAEAIGGIVLAVVTLIMWSLFPPQNL